MEGSCSTGNYARDYSLTMLQQGKLKYVQENWTHKIRRDLRIQTDHLSSVLRPELVLINKKIWSLANTSLPLLPVPFWPILVAFVSFLFMSQRGLFNPLQSVIIHIKVKSCGSVQIIYFIWELLMNRITNVSSYTWKHLTMCKKKFNIK